MDNLPEELVELIAVYVEHRSTLANLSRCDKRLHRICTPHIYRHVHLWAPESFLGEEGPPILPHDAALLLLHHPHVAAQVETLSLRPKRQPIASECTYPEELAPTVSQRCVFLGELLHRLPNLKRLDVHVPTLYVKPPQLRGLEEVLLIGQYRSYPSNIRREPRGPVTLEHARDWVRATKPTKLLLYNIGEDLDDYGGIPISERVALFQYYVQFAREERERGRDSTLPVEHLEMRRVSFNNSSVWSLVSTCAALTTFIYEYQPRHYIDAYCLAVLLALHKETLTHVCIDPIHFVVEDRIVGLKQLTALKHLKIASTLLLGPGDDDEMPTDDTLTAFIDRFPPNIAKLGILKAEYRRRSLTAALYAFLEVWQEQTPALQVIAIEGSFANPEFYYLMARYSAIADASGLSLWTIENANVEFAGTDLTKGSAERGWGIDEDVHWPASIGEKQRKRLLLDLNMFREGMDPSRNETMGF